MALGNHCHVKYVSGTGSALRPVSSTFHVAEWPPLASPSVTQVLPRTWGDRDAQLSSHSPGEDRREVTACRGQVVTWSHGLRTELCPAGPAGQPWEAGSLPETPPTFLEEAALGAMFHKLGFWVYLLSSSPTGPTLLGTGFIYWLILPNFPSEINAMSKHDDL